MADTYNVNVTLNDFNSFITSEKVVNENNQELSDYVCNVTYTNLTDRQIEAIGETIGTAVQDNLHEVALSGNYNDLNNAPQLPNNAWETIEHEPDEEHEESWTSQQLKSFADVAFSGKTSDLDNDGNFLITESDPIFAASPAGNITNIDIQNWNNKPNIDELLNILDLSQYVANITNMSTEENNNNNSKLQSIGASSTYVLGLNSFINNITNETLMDNISNFVAEYFNQQKSSYIISNYETFLVTNISLTNDENTHQPIYYQISLTNSSLLNYSNIRETQSNITAEQANNVLSNLYNSANYINNLIIDIENNIIYFSQINNIIKYNQLFNLEDFANIIQDETNKNKVLNLGTENTYILNADQIVINEQYSLIDELSSFVQTYNNIGRSSYLISNNNLLLITNVLINNNYIQIDLKLSNINNYNLIRPNIINSNNAQTVLTNLNINNNQSMIILDLEQKVIYCKIKEEQN